MSSKDYESRNEGKIHWGFAKVLIVLILYSLSGTCIVLGLKPLFDMDFDTKNFANLVFVIFHGFYMFSFIAVHRKSHFIFWATSYMLLSGTTLLFYYYDDLFL